MIRQIQRDYPPYPSDVGVYYANAQTQSHTSHPHYAAQYAMQSTPPQCISPQHGAMPQSRFDANAKIKGPRHPGILKNYKSCPVSPVHEEIDWSTTITTATAVDGPRPPQPCRRHDVADPKHRHSMYMYSDTDDGKTILDMIHADTEKMIAEITQKYGDIDIDAPMSSLSNRHDDANNNGADDDVDDHDDDDDDMSSDSLEDCSLDFDCVDRCQTTSLRRKKTVCNKKHRKNEPISMMPTRSVSDYFIYDEFYLNRNRNVSLSDILNDDADKPKPNDAFLNSQRHSSASFFLAPERKSQESLISDDMSGCGGVSYCNSMESILSDESECKSAPLEVLFTKTKRDLMIARTSNVICDGRFDAQPITSSKSYGSSPNSNVFDYFMDQQYRAAAGAAHRYQDRDACNIANYDYDSLLMSTNTSARTSNRCSPLPPPPPEFQNIITKSSMATAAVGIPNSCTFPSMSGLIYQQRSSDDFIPRFASKNDQYSSQTNKSLSKEFATERQVRNSNPLYHMGAAAPTAMAAGGDDDSDLFQRKPIKPAIPAKPSNLMDIAKPLPSTSATAKAIDEANAATSNIKRSCSFEIEMFHNRGRVLQQKSAAKKYEQNLQKFEKEHRHRMRNSQAQFGGTLEMPYVPHKPPVANRRSASMKSKKGTKPIKDHAKPIESNAKNALIDKNQSAKTDVQCDDANEHDEQTIEIYITEKAVCDDDNMDSLDLYMKPKLYKENSVDSLDETPKPSAVSMDFLSKADATKFRDIEKKIDVINKLVELEEKKLEQERCAKELRMRPFTCNPKEKGYVRSLTVNFDNLAKSIKYERELSLRLKEQNEIRRNHSLPDVLEDTKYRFKCGFGQRRQRSTDTYLDGYGRAEGVGV